MGDIRGKNGRFLPGSAGRPVGAKNKIRENLKQFIEKNLPDLQKHYDTLEAKEKLKFLNDLLPFVVAKLQGISSVDGDGNDIEPQTRIDYTQLSERSLKEILKHTITDEN